MIYKDPTILKIEVGTRCCVIDYHRRKCCREIDGIMPRYIGASPDMEEGNGDLFNSVETIVNASTTLLG